MAEFLKRPRGFAEIAEITGYEGPKALEITPVGDNYGNTLYWRVGPYRCPYHSGTAFSTREDAEEHLKFMNLVNGRDE